MTREELEAKFAPLLLEYVLAAMNLQYAESITINAGVEGHAEHIRNQLASAQDRVRKAADALLDAIEEIQK